MKVSTVSRSIGTRAIGAKAVGFVLVGSLGLVACGSDNSTTTAPKATGSAAVGASADATASGPAIACASGSILASGSSAQKNAMTQWIANFQTACNGATVNYQSVGSGAGIASFIAGNTAFAGSDSALKPDELVKATTRCGGPAIDLPMVSGAIAIAYNLPSVPKLTLTPVLIAKIFAGAITKWNDPAIVAVNGSAQLPATTIQTFHRSDSSGTTDNVTKYLVASAGDAWTYGKGKDWKAPGGQGAKGSDLVTSGIKAAEGGVGYVEYSFAKNANLGVAAVDNGGGAVELSGDTAATAVGSATVVGTGSDLSLKLDYATKVAGAYPIVLVTYEITCLKGLKAADLALTKAFLTYTASDAGQGILNGLGYAPLPVSIQAKVQAALALLS